MKKIRISVAILMLSLLTACTGQERVPMFSSELEYLTFDESVSGAYCVVFAKLDSTKESKSKRLYNFSLIDQLKGSSMPNTFSVSEGYGEYFVENLDQEYTSIAPKFKEGSNYILVLSKYSSVYIDEDEYMDIGDIVIEVGNNEELVQFNMYRLSVDLGINNLKDIKSKVEEITRTSEKVEAYGLPYTKSETIDDIIEFSQYIYHVRVGDISIRSKTSNRDTYLCEVIDTLKGDKTEEIQVTLFKDTVKKGEEYILLLNRGEKSLLYALSSRNSVRNTQEKDNISKLIK